MIHSDYLKKKKNRETRKKIISVISAIVVFVTTYALILPAITLDVSKAGQEPGIAFEQMQFRATAAAAAVTAADSTAEDVQAEEPAAEESAVEEPAAQESTEEEIIKEEAAEHTEEETSAVSDQKEEADQAVEEVPAEPVQEEAPAAETEEIQIEEDGSADEKADEEPSSEPVRKEAQTAGTQKSADQAAVDQPDKSDVEATDAAAAASTEEKAAEFRIPALDALDFDEILTGKTDFYFYHVEDTDENETITSDSVDDWKKVGPDTILAPEDFVRVYLSYEIPAGALNETNSAARCRLPAGLELSDKQIKAINKYENSFAASRSGSEHDNYLGAEAIEGSRTPDEKEGDEYISATVKAEKVYKDGEYAGQDLIFTFIPYTVEKNQISYDKAGRLTSEGRDVKGFFTFDLTTAQIDFEKTEKETVEKADGTTEEIQYSKAEVVFVKENNKKNIDEIRRTLTMAAPAENEEPKTLTSKGTDYTVTVSYTDDAQIPDKAELAVREIEKDSEEYASYLEQAKGAVDENKFVNEARFFDITILADGKKVEPRVPVNVQITFTGIEQTNTDDTQLLHYKEGKKVEVMDQAEFSKSEEPENEAKAVDTVQFETDGFSVYGIVGTELVTEFTIANPDGENVTYLVTVTYGSDANIPEGSTLRVTPFAEGSADYESARNAVLADKKAKDEFIDLDDFNLAALDISIIDPDGREIEPEAAVTVDIKIKDLPEVENLNEIKETLEIQHHVEVPDGVVVEKVFAGSLEGSYEMDTDENVAKEGIAVDPDSVSEEDFRNTGSEEEDVIDASFDTEEFSTFTITWRTGYNARRVIVHYVDESGHELDIDNPAATHPDMTANSSSPAFLIYDIAGYQYSYTYRNTNTAGNRILPLLAKNNSYWRYAAANSTSFAELSNGDNIYVVYSKKTDPTIGGTPVIEDLGPEDWPQDPAAPQFYKSSENNGNGSNTVSLSIEGGEKEYTQSTKANVIVVFDTSGSMDEDLNGQTRLARAKKAVNDMANTLLNGDIEGVKMALVSFSTTAGTVQEFTDSFNTYTRAVNNLNASGGTNWEQALSIANRMAVDSDAATFVVFVTDGDPTYRVSRGNYTNDNLDMRTNSTYDRYREYGLFGMGTDNNSTTVSRCFDAAVPEVSSILASNKTFYAIGVSSSVTKAQNLVDEAGGGTAYLATDSDALEDAFENITQSIKTTLGFGDVEITDGITELANVEMKVMQEVDPESFTYYKVTSSGQSEWDPVSEGAGLASYDPGTGSVTWNMGEGFQLEDGVTYTVTFKAWPSQQAYDLVAQLNNGEKVYAAGQPGCITDEERAQIVELMAPTETSQGSYTLKTNTDSVRATYSQTSATGTTVTVSGETGLKATYHEGKMEDMGLTSQLLTIKKIFEHSLDPRTVESVTLKLQRMVNDSGHSMADFNVPGTDSPEIVLGSHNNWEYSFYVAPGFILDGKTLEKGYKFTVTEPDLGEHTVRYDLIPEIVNPMVVDGDLQLIGDGDGNQALTAINRTRSAIEIHKTLYDVDGSEIYPETEFTITGQLLGPDGRPFTSQETAAPVAYYMYDKDGNATTGRMHFPNTANISFTLKPGEFIRFVNVLEGCTFVFREDSMPDNYELDSLAAIGRQRTEDDPAYTYSIELSDEEAHLVEGTTTISTTDEGIIGNTNYKLDFYNKRLIPLPDLELIKVDQDDSTKKLNDAEFELHKDSVDGDLVTRDGNGKEIVIKTGNKEDSAGPDGWYHIGFLPAGTYYLVETAEPTGYVLDDTPVMITVAQNGSSYTVTALRDDESVLSGPADGVFTITVSDERAAKYIKVFKYETGTTPEKALQGAQFTLRGPEGTDIEYTGLATNADGFLVFGDSRTYIELPFNDAAYTLIETTAPDGYNKMTETVDFTVSASGVSGRGSGYSVVSGTEPIDGSEVTVYTLKVQNSAGFELPNTGGSGTLPYTLGGIALIMASALMYGFRLRRRERRLN